ncbi:MULTISPECIES: hypothetical protein [Paenibacillus]|uniref:Uncharacterized protein n=1 Tax=Paenibacillus violae TaxID=3077234 RepID=A0ABU3R668_9BACL|nr:MULTISPECIES: hypothetical protein [Paenibacillus]MDU0199754.1 hypothetical protein [Paenibacillus sp. PFR10]MEC0268031.1 hypothetical protein [Paenibacillus anseongense]
MSMNNIDFLAVVRSCIPQEAEIVQLQQQGNPAAILYADVDGDGFPEITAMYRFLDNQYLFSLKDYSGNWFPIASASTGGIREVTDFAAAPVSRRQGWDVIIGWQQKGTSSGSGSELDIIQWTSSGFQRMIPPGTTYDHLEIEDMPTRDGKDGLCELALWVKEQNQAYQVQTYRWDPYRLVPTQDVHPYYFQRVSRYYEDLVRDHPDEPAYRSLLEDAKKKVGGEGSA